MPSQALQPSHILGHSGVLINGLYEVQVLDSYQALTYPDGQAAAIYGQSPPLVNAGKPPGEWQTYDIIFESPRWNDQGELVKRACITVLHNGVVVQNHYELSGCTDGIGGVPWRSLGNYERRHSPEVFVELQDHNNPVRYRNIWIRKLGNPDKSGMDKASASPQPFTRCWPKAANTMNGPTRSACSRSDENS